MARGRAVYQRVVSEGGTSVVKQGLGEMPLTLWVIVAAVILYLYIRRANVGIDLHPGEKVQAPLFAPQPRVELRGTVPPVLPHVPGTFGPPNTGYPYLKVLPGGAR